MLTLSKSAGAAILSAATLSLVFANGASGQDAEPADPALTEEEVAELTEEGAEVYDDNCVTCHGDEGDGGNGPVLAGNEVLESQSTVLNQILFGGAYMPEFSNLSDREIAAAATFIRMTWGNDFGPVTEADVAARRGE